MFFLLFAFLDISTENNKTGINSANTTGFLVKDLIDDGQLTKDEMARIGQLNCEDIKRMLGTNKEACIYFKDADGNIVDMLNDGRFGVGCPGLEIDGQKICASGK